MKILHIITDLRKGGAERIATDIVRELNNRPGITAMLVLLEDHIAYDISDIRDFVKVIPASVTLSVLRSTAYDVSRLQDFVDSYRPDIIHTHLFMPDLVIHSLEYRGARWFTHCHWNTKEVKRPPLLPLSRQGIIDWRVYHYILARYRHYDNQFIAISPNTYEFYRDNLPDLRKNVHYLANAVNVAAFSKNITEHVPAGMIRLISAGSLIERKNQILQIEVAKVLRSRGVAFHLDIYGQGVMRDVLQARIDELHLGDYVTLRGVSDDIGAHLAESTLFLHTALYEPFGLVIVEAMAAGLPVVAVDGGGNRELIQDGMTGYLVPRPDAILIADRILDATAPELYASMKQGAINASQQYDIIPYVTKLLDLYAQAPNSKG